MKNLILVISLYLLSHLALFAQNPIKVREYSTKHGPENGSLIIIGGGKVSEDIWEKFAELAGGKEAAKIVVITAASGDSAAYRTGSVEQIKTATGIENVTLFHTDDLLEANSEAYIKPLIEATGVYFVGGRQWRIADSYLNTLAHKAFLDLLDRGGVIAGSSAGASIQGSLLWRGDTKGPQILIGDHTQGLAFLRNSVIDQHLLRRNRHFDLVETVQRYPELVGIGLDESTAVLIQKDNLEVLGDSYVAVYENENLSKDNVKNSNGNESYYVANGPFFFLRKGQKYNLGSREIIRDSTEEQELTAR
jgi:cyanophycinase